MAELFIKQAKQYAVVRPTYPKQLFEFIASKTPFHHLVWDVGTGSGQAIPPVSYFFPLSLIYISIFAHHEYAVMLLGVQTSILIRKTYTTYIKKKSFSPQFSY